MFKQPYVLDIAVQQIEPVERVLTKLFGVPPIPMHPDMDPSGTQVGTHYTTQGLYSVGLLGLRDPDREYNPKVALEVGPWRLQQRLRRVGEGPFLLGCLVDDIDQHVAALRKQGVRFMGDEPRRYLVGRNLPVDAATSFDAEILYAQHDPDAYAAWIATDPSRAPKDVKTSPRKVYSLGIAVRDLAAAVPVFEQLIESKAYPMRPEIDLAGDLVGAHFPTGGIDSFQVVALREPTRRYAPPEVDPAHVGAWLVQRQLDTRGEGYFHMGLLVDDLDADTAALKAEGIKFLLDTPIRYAVGRTNVVDPATTHGLTVTLAQHDPGAYLRWRKRWAIG